MKDPRNALVDAIMAAPTDMTPRLVLGDWLAERGDPWGELILRQCRGKSIDHLDTSWLASPRIRWVFRDGLPVAFEHDDEFHFDWPDPKYIAHYLLAIKFRRDNKVSEEFWELTEQGPFNRAFGLYEVSPWGALRGNGAIVIRMYHPEMDKRQAGWRPFNGQESHGVLRGEEMFVRGKNVFGLMRLKKP